MTAKITLHTPMTGKLVRRYKRFLADVETPNGEIITVHCPNPGSMQGTQRPGSLVRCTVSPNPNRKLLHTLEMIRVGRIWVGLHAARANQLIGQALAMGAIRRLRGYHEIKSEVKIHAGSRLDFLLDRHNEDPRKAYVEVKSVTMADGPMARFPDAVTERGRRHLQCLMDLHAEGHRAVQVFLVQRGDCDRMQPADEIDPAYGKALREAIALGVEVIVLGSRVRAGGISLEAELPLIV